MYPDTGYGFLLVGIPSIDGLLNLVSSSFLSLSVLPPRVMTTTCERKKTGLKIDLSGLRSQVQVSGTS